MDASQRLIESTQELLWERGYVGTSPKAIQQRAGAGQGSMYHHFTGKADLALAAVRRSAEQLKADAEREFSSPGTAIDKITAYMTREREVLRGCRIGGLTQDPDIIASPELRQPVAETLDWLQHRIAEILTEGQQNGEIGQNLKPAELAATLIAVLQGGYVLARAAQDASAFDRAVAGALAVLNGA
jgi:AcrR family transcriptional regulator